LLIEDVIKGAVFVDITVQPYSLNKQL